MAKLPSLGHYAAPGWLPHIPEYRIIDAHRAFDRVFGGRYIGTGPQTPLLQVQAFTLLAKLHEHIAQGRRELERTLGTPLCREQCCCLHRTPMVTRLETEYIISRTGYYSDLVRLAEQWLLTPHEQAPTFPAELPAVLGGPPTPLRALPQVAQELRALAGLRSPFLLTERDSGRERLVSGPWLSTSLAGGTAQVRRENWDLLEDTQPLVCAVSGVFTLPPAHCTRRWGLGEGPDVRILADPRTLQQGVQKLARLYEQLPEKAQYGLLPAMLLLVARPALFRTHVDSGKVALAKLALGNGSFPFPLWQGAVAGHAERRVTSSAVGASGGTHGARNGVPAAPSPVRRGPLHL